MKFIESQQSEAYENRLVSFDLDSVIYIAKNATNARIIFKNGSTLDVALEKYEEIRNALMDRR